jgi:hypothetical protein
MEARYNKMVFHKLELKMSLQMHAHGTLCKYIISEAFFQIHSNMCTNLEICLQISKEIHLAVNSEEALL